MKTVLSNVYRDIWRTRVTSVAGGLAFFFLLSLIPLLVVAATLLGVLPIPHLFQHGMDLVERFAPGDAVGMLRGILKELLVPRGGLLTIGILGTLWSAAGGFSSMIDALDIAYDARKSRSYFRQQLLAIGLVFVIGGLFAIALAASIMGPEFGNWISGQLGLHGILVHFWTPIRWGVMALSVIIAVELLYFLAPNIKQRLWANLPGAIMATAVWIGASVLLDFYLRHFNSYSKTYGSLGAVMAFMLWVWITCMILLVGAEFNSELQKYRGVCLEGQAAEDNPQHIATPPQPA
ncbi:MAG: YihY/virulence factor BrkB family protein [Acidobacteriaceae bacterium]